jgi:predicted MPP superfamily phosphohydrolase
MPNDRFIRWLHLSDFHVGKDPYADRQIFARIHEHVRERVGFEGAPDLVFITGDLAQSGKAEEYSIFYEDFLQPLLLYALGDRWEGKIYTIPGNHDVDRSIASYFHREEILQPDSQFFDANDKGHREREIVFPRFRAYTESESKEGSDSPKNWLNSEAGAFSQRVEIRGLSLGIVGVNTAWLCKEKDDRHHLTPGQSLLETALKQVQDCDVRIVLGHHPLDWLYDKHLASIRALLGSYHAIYLHGHLHQGAAQREDGAGRDFLAIQAGACFQGRDGDIWINGLLWGELDLQEEEIRLQPRHWNPANHDWPLTTDAFPEIRRREGTDWWWFPWPGSEQEVHAPVSVSRGVPKGWQIVNREFLDARRRGLEEQEALRFFDGSVPTWGLALSPLIPRRAIVGRLALWLSEQPEGRPKMALLVGPGGEGKSTAFLQTIAAILEANPLLQVLWHHDESSPIAAADILALPKDEPWLIATDDADLVVQDLFTVAKALQAMGRDKVAFLLTCRDTDWRAAQGDMLPWSSHAASLVEELSGLDETDATQIVKAWGAFGPEGLGQLAGKKMEDATRLLVERAKQGAELKEGAFFGAMLEVRIGGTLREHMRVLLDRLANREIRPGTTLLDAFTYVAAMHAEGLTFLSRPVLAQALGCNLRDLKSKVLGPLGKEAAAVGAGRSVLTRHRSIARCAIGVLSEVFDVEMDEVYPELAYAAALARKEQGFIPDLVPKLWQYDLAAYFIAAGRQNVALRIGRRVLDADPSNIRSRVNLAKLFRKSGVPEEAARLFRDYSGKMDRICLYEWGTAEGEADDYPLAAWLGFFALSDQASGSPNNENAIIVLAGLGVVFEKLFFSYNVRIFIEAHNAVGVLGLILPLDSLGYFEKYLRKASALGVPEMDSSAALERFEAAARSIGALYDAREPFIARLPKPEDLTFQGLRQLIDGRQQVK